MFLTKIAWISLISQLTSDHPFGRTNVNRDPKPSTLKSETALDVDEAVINASYSDASDEIFIFANLI